jgi:hypothetical protein
MADKDFERRVESAAKKTGISATKLRDVMSRTKGPDGKIYKGEAGLALQKKQKAEQDYKIRSGKIKSNYELRHGD